MEARIRVESELSLTCVERILDSAHADVYCRAAERKG